MYLILDEAGECTIEVCRDKFQIYWFWKELSVYLVKGKAERPYISRVYTVATAGVIISRTEISIGKLVVFFQRQTKKEITKADRTKKYIELSLFKKTNKLV